MSAAIALCEVLGIRFNPNVCTESYKCGWGMDAHDALPIIFSWTLLQQDLNERPIHLTFNLTHGDSSLIIGLDIQQLSSSSFTTSQPKIHITLASESDEIILPIYIRDGNNLQRRAYVDLIGLKPVPTLCSFLTTPFSGT